MDPYFKIMYVMILMISICLDISDIAIITVKNVDYSCIMYNKSEAIHLLENSVLEDIGHL